MSNKSFLRFCVVGVINTLVDVPTFVALHSAGLSILFANIISTSLALIVSLLLNYRYTFTSRSLTPARIVIYIVVTIVGIWALQPIVIKLLLDVNNHVHYTALLVNRFGHSTQINSLVAKLGSLGVSLIWNYTWYSRVVFKNTTAKEVLARSIEEV